MDLGQSQLTVHEVQLKTKMIKNLKTPLLFSPNEILIKYCPVMKLIEIKSLFE